jgi:hypothetical protein
MTKRPRSFGLGLLGGAAGLAAMQLVRALTNPLVKSPTRRSRDVFATERTMSPLGPRYRPNEGPTEALARIAYEKIWRRPPPPRTQRALAWAIHFGYGLAWAGAFGAISGRPRHALRNGALFGAALWLFGDELAVPLLGLADKPTAYHPTRHAQSLLQHLGFGVATVAAHRALAR